MLKQKRTKTKENQRISQITNSEKWKRVVRKKENKKLQKGKARMRKI